MPEPSTISPKDINGPYWDTQANTHTNPALQEAKAQVAERLGEWTLLQIVRKPRSITIEAMVNPKGEAVMSIRKKPNGTVDFQMYGEASNDQPAFHTRTIKYRLSHQVKNELTKSMTRQINPLLAWGTFGFHPQTVKRDIREAAAQIIGEAISPPDQDDTQIPLRTINFKNFHRKTRDIIDRHFIRPDVMDIAKRILHSHPYSSPIVTCTQYNNVVLNTQVFEKLLDSAPLLATHYLRHIATRYPNGLLFKHPGQIVTMIKNEMDLSPAAWRYFCRIRHPATSRLEPQDLRDRIRKAMTMLEQINLPEAPDNDLQDFVYPTNLHDSFRHDNWESGNPWHAWTNTIRQFLIARIQYQQNNPQNQNYPDGLRMLDLHGAADALTHHIENQQPWGPGDWNNIFQRSRRWHRQVARQLQNRPQDSTDDQLTWTSLIPAQKANNLELRPITDGAQMADAAQKLNNCLTTYTKRCHANTTRIFTIHRDQKLVGAAEISLRGQTWEQGQVQMRSRLTAPAQPILNLVQKTVESYQNAQDKQQHQPSSENTT